MLIYSPILTAIAVGFSLLPVIASIITGNHLAKVEEEVSNQNVKYTSTLKDSLSGFSVIKSFKVEAEMIKIFCEDVKKLSRAQSKKMRISILIELLSNAAGFTAQLGVFLIGAYMPLSSFPKPIQYFCGFQPRLQFLVKCEPYRQTKSLVYPQLY